MMLKKPLIKLAVLASGIWATQALAFDIYGFIPYQSRMEEGKIIKGRPAEDWFAGLGILPIHVIYDNRILDYPFGKKSKKIAKINIEKIQKVASDLHPDQPVMVSLDMESWDRFDADTPALLLQTIQAFREVRPNAIVGLYATVPQNTYGWRADKVKNYDSLNYKYTAVANAVDYFSPSLYNYSPDSFESWREGARYNIAASRKYSSKKKILPFITPEVRESGATRWLSYDEMMQRLQALQALGADGCIVWASSQSRDKSAAPPVLDPKNGWLKALVDFGAHISKL